jgi:arylsulfatase A-like enzyme
MGLVCKRSRTILIWQIIIIFISFSVSAHNKPNIIIIFTDDHGFADLGIQNQVNDVKTPFIDQLANEGVLMTSGYITAHQCIPLRAGLITGRYQQRFAWKKPPVLQALRLRRIITKACVFAIDLGKSLMGNTVF